MTTGNRDIVAEREHEATNSRAVDLDQVAARLQAIPADHELFRRAPSRASTLSPPPQEERDAEDLQQEKQSFHELVNAGGRPPYPFHLLEDFFWHPEQFLEHEQYRDIVRFWREKVYDKAARTCFCQCHLWRWNRFRSLQRFIRDRNVVDEQTLYIAVSAGSWEKDIDRSSLREGKWGFSEYAENVSRRLAKYGFTRPFQLDRDLNRQDKLTTWIEYLGFEHLFYDAPASYVKRFQRRHDEAWTKLVELNVLRPDETYEALHDSETLIRNAYEEKRAEKAVQSATATVLWNEKAKLQDPGKILREQTLADESTLIVAKERHKTIKLRNDAIADFRSKTCRYDRDKENAERTACLLRWIKQQIPDIEIELSSFNGAADDTDRDLNGARPQELNEPNAAQNSQVRCRIKGKRQSLSPPPSHETRKRSRSDSSENANPPKRLKHDGQSGIVHKLTPAATSSATPALIQATNKPPEDGGGNSSSSEPLRVLKPLRRSARIKNRQAPR